MGKPSTAVCNTVDLTGMCLDLHSASAPSFFRAGFLRQAAQPEWLVCFHESACHSICQSGCFCCPGVLLDGLAADMVTNGSNIITASLAALMQSVGQCLAQAGACTDSYVPEAVGLVHALLRFMLAIDESMERSNAVQSTYCAVHACMRGSHAALHAGAALCCGTCCQMMLMQQLNAASSLPWPSLLQYYNQQPCIVLSWNLDCVKPAW